MEWKEGEKDGRQVPNGFHRNPLLDGEIQHKEESQAEGPGNQKFPIMGKVREGPDAVVYKKEADKREQER
jgi:hypothetical protein